MSGLSRRHFLSTAAGGMVLSALRPALSFGRESEGKASPSRPNILIYIADDQHMASVGCYGADPGHTPNIDRLAEQGMRFTNAYTPSSICTPNRGALLSGLYPMRNGAHPNHSGFRDGVKSLPNYMAELGYRAAIAGKDGIQRPSDRYKWETRIRKTRERVPGADEPKHDRHRKSDFAAIEAFVTADPSRPFCLVHAASLPHSPYLNELPNGLSGYDASNFYCDHEFGVDLDILERNGLADDTLVLYINDNEAGVPRSKFTLYDTGIHVPMVLRWPGRIAPGATTDAMVGTVDVLPTLIEAAGGAPPEDLDGRSFLDVLESRTDAHHSELYFTFTAVSVASQRQTVPYPIRAVRTHRYKYIRYLNHTIPHPKAGIRRATDGGMFPYEELYDIISDPDEKENLADRPDMQSAKRALSGKLDAWMAQQGDRGIESEREALLRFPPKKKG